ncbi:hypothetical protein F4778DRAFT_785818 [Xylariomycetidae sp. FL2044]|nr:hypothetical protein F4778DRAFT_785818 [Xylariomycetidae sp. FL2044]
MARTARLDASGWCAAALSTSASASSLVETTAKLTEPNPPTSSYDRHDRNEPFTSSSYRRQQRRPSRQTPQPHTPDQTTPPSSQPRLRRTPRFTSTPSPRPEHPQEQPARQFLGRVTVAPGPRGHYVLTSTHRKARVERAGPRRRLSQGNLSEDTGASSTPAHSQLRPRTFSSSGVPKTEPHPAFRISRHTHSAILYALEETLRGPKSLSDDYVELYAQMADIMGGHGPPTSNGNATSSRSTAARAAVGSPSGIRGPRVIMQERAAREQRQKEERERLERQHLEEEVRLQEEASRKEKERRTAAAASAPAGAGPSSTDATAGIGEHSGARRLAQNFDNGDRTAGPPRVPPGAQMQSSQMPRHGRSASAATQAFVGPSPSGPGMAGPSATQPQQQPGTSTGETRGRNSFPHAFERWETLSAHWEGLTNFWIRRLEQNAAEISNDPISQQLSRQVTDLSSAGANLFHAVVELQRLRASSERKFQRWFFETRADLERHQEVAAMVGDSLNEERRLRAEAMREVEAHQRVIAKYQKREAEMRNEIQIGKEEARRAWEELGRREQEERDRTTSLQLGQPTVVGGVQVVPMTQGVSRGNSQRESRAPGPGEAPDYTQSPTSHTVRTEYTQAPAVQPVATSDIGNAAAFQTPSSVHHQQSYGSEGTYSEGEYTIDAQGNFVRDSLGHKIPYREPGSAGSDAVVEEFETPATQPGVYQPTGSAAQQPQYSSAPDYSGTGYTAPGWEEVQPRHHHPTRLSDVPEEEEERSRTSASQSQVSRV